MEKEWNCRPPIFNNGKRELGRVVRASRRATFKEIEQLISTKACEDTIRKELKKFSYASRVVVKKPFLNEKQQKLVERSRNLSMKKGMKTNADFINQVYEPVLLGFYKGLDSPVLMEDDTPIHRTKIAAE
ncbi:hypothetical protein G6F70_000079 [Rhizopus microsporus]|nr:hypothetical protein G6F71_005092 [Rhizopus microsporus]KAG1204942.1 hypothetical protein G6F70_000079 [Rhizopus microsporus]KAG1215969.1 hypothetical protein G6F69_000499 [Rhizopus microsporus]